MRVHLLEREQVLPGSPDEVFGFFADARNLEAITRRGRLRVRFGPLGALAHRLFVARDFAAIFDFRAGAIGAQLRARP